MSRRLLRAAAGVGIATIITLLVGLGVEAIGQSVGTLAHAIPTALETVVPEHADLEGGMDLVTVCGPRNDFDRGRQLAVFVLLLGGIPVSMLGIALMVFRARTPALARNPRWAVLFRAGFIFQLCSLPVAGWFTLPLLAVAIVDRWTLTLWMNILPFAAVLFGNLGLGIAGLSAWRTLGLVAAAQPLITIRT
jgi:hypothetical protein